MTYKKNLNLDGKQLWYDFVRVYPKAFDWIIKYWWMALISVSLLVSAFYFDTDIRILFISLHNNTYDIIFKFGWWYGTGLPSLYLMLTFYLYGLLFNKSKIRGAGVLIFESYIYSGLVTLIFKSLIGRWRPFTNHGYFSFYGWSLGPNEHLSFYSGHSTVAFALSAVLANMTSNIYLKMLFYLLAVITAISRVYHDQHWFSDVLMGFFVSLLVTYRLFTLHSELKKSETL